MTRWWRSCLVNDEIMSCFPFLSSFLTITSPLLFSSPVLFTLRPILSTLTVGVFCYQCFEHSSRQWMCRNCRLSAGSWGEYIDKRWGDATHNHAYSDIPSCILYLMWYSNLFYSFTFYFTLFYPIKSFSIPFDCTLFHSFPLYSIIFISTLS